MTVATTSNKTIALGNGATTVFNYGFLIQAASQLVVVYTDATGLATVLSPSTYTVAGVGQSGGGTVTYPLSGSPIASGTRLTMYRSVLVNQLTKLTNQGSYNPAVVEAALDYIVMIEQQIIETVGRGLVVPIDDVNPIVTLPTQTQRSNNGAGGLVLGFNAAGDPVLYASPGSLTISAYITGLMNQATAALARAYLGSGTTGDALFLTATAAAARAAIGLAPASAFVHRNGTSLSLSNAVITPVPFTTEVYDDVGIHDNAVNPERLTVPAGYTRAKLRGRATFASSAVGERTINFSKNGAAFAGGGGETRYGNTSPTTVSLFIASPMVPVVAGDYFTMDVYQNSGGALTLNGNSSETWFGIELIP